MTGVFVPSRSRHNDYSLPENLHSHSGKHARNDFLIALLIGSAIPVLLYFTIGSNQAGSLLFSAEKQALELVLFGLFSLALVASVYAYRRWQDQTALLHFLANTMRTDTLTGTFNRSSIDDELEKELSRARRYQCNTSVLMIDLDHFKTINDLYGHKTGDLVIQQLVSCIKKSIRVSDTLGRYGGEEFMVILPQTNQAAATIVAERIRQTVLETPLSEDGEQIISSVSIGVAEYNPTTDTADKLVDHSDQALYCAKHAGRNQVQCWTMH